jgi:hypothetical protein
MAVFRLPGLGEFTMGIRLDNGFNIVLDEL